MFARENGTYSAVRRMRIRRNNRMTDGSLIEKETDRTSRSWCATISTLPWHQSVMAFCQCTIRRGSYVAFNSNVCSIRTRRQHSINGDGMVSKATRADSWDVIRMLRSTAVLLALSASLSACVSARHLSAPATAAMPAPAPAVVEFARSLVGTPYRFGGNSPDSGFDCSGLVVYVMSLSDIAMPRTVQDQYRVGAPVAWNRLRAGDLVFFTTTGPGAT